MKKLRAGFFSFTGDEGCMVYLTEMFNNTYFKIIPLLDIRHFRMIKPEKGSDIRDLDVAFVEGAISTNSEARKLKKIRSNSKRVVAIGECAIQGWFSAQRNTFDKKKRAEIAPLVKSLHQRKRVSPLKEIVKVDCDVPGCPMDEGKFMKVLNNYLKEFGILKGGMKTGKHRK